MLAGAACAVEEGGREEEQKEEDTNTDTTNTLIQLSLTLNMTTCVLIECKTITTLMLILYMCPHRQQQLGCS
jgi:hypothetical protein